MSVDLRKIKKLIELVEESGISELEVRDGEETIRISRPLGLPFGSLPASAQAAAVAAPPAASAASASVARRPNTKIVEVKAPMAGTFFRAPAPGERPFVEPGQTVQAGAVLCIIESMKMMNEITSEQTAVCIAVMVRDGEAIGSGQVLLRLEV